MLFVKLIRFIKGIVGFVLTGGFAERFLNLCARAGIPVFDVERRKEDILAFTTARSYKKLRPIARKTGVRMRLCYKGGLPFLLRRYRRRAGLLAGALLFALFLGVMSRFIWNIELEGNDTIADEYLLRALDEIGVREGAYIGGIDTADAERQMLLKIPELSWIAINLRASTAQVEIEEREMPPEMIDVGTPCNVIAARTGQIVQMEVYDGYPVRKVGDAVQEGELIVSSFMEGIKAKDRGYFTHARAKVVAEFVQDVEISVPLQSEIHTPKGDPIKKRSVTLFGVRVPLYLTRAPQGPCDVTSKTTQPIVLGLKLPLLYRCDTIQPLDVQRAALDETQAREEALSKLWDYEQDFAEIGEIVSKTAQGKAGNGKYVIRAQFTLRQDIARQKAIEVVEDPAAQPAPPQGGTSAPQAEAAA